VFAALRSSTESWQNWPDAFAPGLQALLGLNPILLLDLERQQGLGILAPGAKSPGRKPAPAHARPEVAANLAFV
jgi:hypothetical protein